MAISVIRSARRTQVDQLIVVSVCRFESYPEVANPIKGVDYGCILR